MSRHWQLPFVRAVQAWWCRDRIRVSPGEGRLLRIAPGDVLTWGDHQAEVLSRTVTELPQGALLSWCCRTASGCGQLVLQVDSRGEPCELEWIEPSQIQHLDCDDLQVWARRSML